jgi:hypothetical protein
VQPVHIPIFAQSPQKARGQMPHFLLGERGFATEILRCAQDDGGFTGVGTGRLQPACSHGYSAGLSLPWASLLAFAWAFMTSDVIAGMRSAMYFGIFFMADLPTGEP